MIDDDDPMARLATALDRLSAQIETTLIAVSDNRADLKATRKELRLWQTVIVVLAVLVLAGFVWTAGIFSYVRQADCNRTNEARAVLSEQPDVDLPPRDCSWPA